MLDTGLFLGVLPSGSVFAAARFGRKFEEILPLTCMGIVLALFLFGAAGLLSAGVYAIVLAADFLNLTVIRDLFTRFLEFIPTLFVSVLILFAGLLFGKLMGNIIDNASRANNLKGGFLISRAVNIFIVFFCALIAVENLGFANQLVNNVVIIVLASLGLAFGIGVGLGSKELVADFLRDLFKKEEK